MLVYMAAVGILIMVVVALVLDGAVCVTVTVSSPKPNSAWLLLNC